ncbi:cupin domain-containing protein [Austwickia sp. TVS 96-490-7B]|uniref:cupin domain-containing protein n=1 Tax=Austwickia sp. TVS 96-490-7B TaxID=2830843 RepID=UPI00210361CA|nr:cupin domain-containing protein [Austwickia sp. TVS 96-490-7B]
MSSHTQSLVRAQLAAELPVVPASTTSRVLLHNDCLRVVQFTFDAGQQLTEHSSPRAVICELVEGLMRFTVDGVEYRLDPGDIVYLAPHAPHSVIADAPSRLTLTMVDVPAVDTARAAITDIRGDRDE